MREILIIAIVTLGAFTAISLVCAVGIALSRNPGRIGPRNGPGRADPFSQPFGEIPGFTAEQLREITRHSMTRIEQDAQRRSFVYGNTHLSNPRITREMVDAAAQRIPAPPLNNQFNSGRTCPPPPDADGVGHPHHSPRVHAVRNFFRGLRHA